MGLLVLVVVGMTIARRMLSDPSAPPHTVSTRTSLTWPLRRRGGGLGRCLRLLGAHGQSRVTVRRLPGGLMELCSSAIIASAKMALILSLIRAVLARPARSMSSSC